MFFEELSQLSRRSFNGCGKCGGGIPLILL
jgi:hypothetical protein